jgi:hypothetical protein
LVGKAGWRPLEKPRYKWEDNIKMDLRGIEWGNMDWGQGQVEGSSEHGNEPSGFIKYWEILEWLRDCRILWGHLIIDSSFMFRVVTVQPSCEMGSSVRVSRPLCKEMPSRT